MRTLRVAAAVVASVAVLAGCSSGEQANETLPSSSTSASAEPTATLPPIGPADFPMPVEAREKTKAGAEAFLDYYFAVRERTTEGESIRELIRGCQVCNFLADQRDSDSASGYVSTGGESSITVLDSFVQDDKANVIFTITAAPVTVVDAAGAPVPDRGDPGTTNQELDSFMVWDDARVTWLMTEFGAR